MTYVLCVIFQSLVRSSLNLAPVNQRNKEVVNMAKALPLLPPAAIPIGLDFLEHHSEEIQQIRPFLDYIQDRWISGNYQLI